MTTPAEERINRIKVTIEELNRMRGAAGDGGSVLWEETLDGLQLMVKCVLRCSTVGTETLTLGCKFPSPEGGGELPPAMVESGRLRVYRSLLLQFVTGPIGEVKFITAGGKLTYLFDGVRSGDIAPGPVRDRVRERMRKQAEAEGTPTP